MKYAEYLNQMREIQQYLADNFDNNVENNIKTIKQFFTDLKKKQTPQQIKELLHFISIFSNDYHRSHNFFEVLEEIIKIYKEDIHKYFSNRQIFRIFYKNKRILLILFETKILIPDIFIFKTFLGSKYIKKMYIQYFYPEFKDFITKKSLKDINENISDPLLQINPNEIESDLESFKQKRRKGENDKYICELIQKDAIEDFIIYVNRNNLPLTSIISQSIFETNRFLLKKEKMSLIEYATFFGSIQILKYLFMNNIELTQSLWLYAIHGKNPEIIHFLEENKVIPLSNSFQNIFKESIRCHHNEIADYIHINLLNSDSNLQFQSIYKKFYNYHFFPDELQINSDDFYEFCEFDYISIVEIILENYDVNINEFKTIEKSIDFNIPGCLIFEKMMKRKQTPFHASIRNGNIEIMKLLMKKLENLDINDRVNEKALEDPLSYETTLLSIAVQNCDIDIVNYLLSHTSVDVNLYSNKYISLHKLFPQHEETTPLYFAIQNEDIEMINLLLSQTNIDINKKSGLKTTHQQFITSAKTPLFNAVEKENLEIIKILISREDISINEICIFNDDYFDCTYMEGTVLAKTVFIGNNEIFNLLIMHKDIDCNSTYKYRLIRGTEIQEKSVFYAACELKKKEIVSSFVSLTNVNVNHVNTKKFKDDEGFIELTPLYVACENRDIEIVQILLKCKDININYKLKYQTTQKSLSWSEYREKSVLLHAIDKENIEIIRILLEQQNLNVNDIFLIRRKVSFTVSKQIEQTALHLAVEKNSIDTLRLLLTRKDLQINLKYNYYKYMLGFYNLEKIQTTALHMAVKNNNIAIVRLLLTYDGIDLSINDESGKKPIDVAQNNEIINLLKNQ